MPVDNNSESQGSFPLDIESKKNQNTAKRARNSGKSRVKHKPTPEQQPLKVVRKQPTIEDALPPIGERSVEVPPAVVDVLAHLELFRRNFELFAHRDSKLGLLKNRRDRDIAVRESILPLWGKLAEKEVKDLDPEIDSQRNILTRTNYAFNKREKFKLINSAALGDYTLRFSRKAVFDNDLVISDYAISGVAESYSRADRDNVSEDVTAFNTAMYGKELGKFLKGGKFVKCILGGVEPFLESKELSFQETHLVTPHGTYYIEDYTFKPGERFGLKEEWLQKTLPA